MLTEKQWVASLVERLELGLSGCQLPGGTLRVEVGHRLAYLVEATRYSASGQPDSRSAQYETDLLICDVSADGSWVPRVVIECKTDRVTTHDALTYSSKAATHKHVHPYLRYGFIIGNYGDALPARLVRHGAHFDFMLAWKTSKGSAADWRRMVQVLKQEIEASRLLQRMLQENRTRQRREFAILHRPLVLE